MLDLVPSDVLGRIIAATTTRETIKLQREASRTNPEQLRTAEVLHNVSCAVRKLAKDGFLCNVREVTFYPTSPRWAWYAAGEALRRCTELRSVNIEYAELHWLSPACWKSIFESEAVSISLRGSYGIELLADEDVLGNIRWTKWHEDKALRTVDLTFGQGVDDSIACGLLRDPNLGRLVLKGCADVSDKTAHRFLEMRSSTNCCSNLREISLAYCNVSDQGLVAIARAAPNLRKIVLAEESANLWSTGVYTSVGLKELAKEFPRLEISFEV